MSLFIPRLSGESLSHAIEVSKNFGWNCCYTWKMTQAERKKCLKKELKSLLLRSLKSSIFNGKFIAYLLSAKKRYELIKGLRTDLRESGMSNIGRINALNQKKRDLVLLKSDV